MQILRPVLNSVRRASPALGLLAPIAFAPCVMTAQAPGVIADTIRGFVFDSLRHEPLGGATVIASPGGEQATATSDGRYTLISAERITRV